jgi:hypothetical protein
MVVIKCPYCGAKGLGVPGVVMCGLVEGEGFKGSPSGVPCGSLLELSEEGKVTPLSKRARRMIMEHRDEVEACLQQVREYYWG